MDEGTKRQGAASTDVSSLRGSQMPTSARDFLQWSHQQATLISTKGGSVSATDRSGKEALQKVIQEAVKNDCARKLPASTTACESSKKTESQHTVAVFPPSSIHNWREYQAKDGRKYYHNFVTKETQWNIPPGWGNRPQTNTAQTEVVFTSPGSGSNTAAAVDTSKPVSSTSAVQGLHPTMQRIDEPKISPAHSAYFAAASSKPSPMPTGTHADVVTSASAGSTPKGPASREASISGQALGGRSVVGNDVSSSAHTSVEGFAKPSTEVSSAQYRGQEVFKRRKLCVTVPSALVNSVGANGILSTTGESKQRNAGNGGGQSFDDRTLFLE